MKWRTMPRSTGLIEFVCEHGVGHPTYDSAKRVAKYYKHSIKTWLSHGCDGCCKRKDFPGR